MEDLDYYFKIFVSGFGDILDDIKGKNGNSECSFHIPMTEKCLLHPSQFPAMHLHLLLTVLCELCYM